jgi:CheY-like chemotaxis protein
MDDKRLQELLDQLLEEINKTVNVDEKGRQLLEKTRADILALMEREKDERAASHAETTSRLEEAIALMEATHPDLTILLTDLLNILSNAGI